MQNDANTSRRMIRTDSACYKILNKLIF